MSEPTWSNAAKRHKILLVDDEAPVRRVLKRILESEGFVCREADSAHRALELLEAEEFSLVLLDIQMPGQSGLQLLPLLSERFHDLAVIMATVEDDRKVAEQALQDGAYGYVTKPFQRNEIIINVMAALERRRLNRTSRDNKALLESKVRERTAALSRLASLQRQAIDISIRFIGLMPHDWAAGVVQALANIGAFLGADRGYLIEFSPDDQGAAITHEWHGPGIPPHPAMPREAMLDDKLPWLARQIRAGQVVHLPNIAQAPPEARPEMDYFSLPTMQSLVVVPMLRQDHLTGLIGFEAIHQASVWPEEIISLLQLMGNIFVNSLERQHLERERAAMHAKLLQSEKLAAIGQLAAGVAHEINTPIGFISSNLVSLQKYTQRLVDFIQAQATALDQLHDTAITAPLAAARKNGKIDYITGDIQELIMESLDGANKVKEIVQDLKNFARADEKEPVPADINTCLDNTLAMVRNELKYKATVKREFSELPDLLCFPRKLGQAFTNLLVNAAQAIESHGEIIVRTWQENEAILVAIADTGSGIAEENLLKIFDPFFTTKEVGQGTGLGLSITHDIITKAHHGEITVTSELGRGTTFTVRLPLGTTKTSLSSNNPCQDKL